MNRLWWYFELGVTAFVFAGMLGLYVLMAWLTYQLQVMEADAFAVSFAAAMAFLASALAYFTGIALRDLLKDGRRKSRGLPANINAV